MPSPYHWDRTLSNHPWDFFETRVRLSLTAETHFFNSRSCIFNHLHRTAHKTGTGIPLLTTSPRDNGVSRKPRGKDMHSYGECSRCGKWMLEYQHSRSSCIECGYVTEDNDGLNYWYQCEFPLRRKRSIEIPQRDSLFTLLTGFGLRGISWSWTATSSINGRWVNVG